MKLNEYEHGMHESEGRHRGIREQHPPQHQHQPKQDVRRQCLNSELDLRSASAVLSSKLPTVPPSVGTSAVPWNSNIFSDWPNAGLFRVHDCYRQGSSGLLLLLLLLHCPGQA